MSDKTSVVGLLLRAIIVLLAALALLGAYFWTHKPFDIDFGLAAALRIAGALLDLGTALVIALAAGGIGRAALARLAWDGASRLERVGVEGLIGLALLSTALLPLGMLGLFARLPLWGVTLLLAALCWRGLRGWLADGRALVSGLRIPSAWVAFCALFVGVMLPLPLLEAVSTPVRWDSLAYQLVAPARYLDAGRILPQPDNFYLGFPQQVNLLFGLAMSAFDRDTSAAPIHYLYGLFGVLAAMGAARRAAGVAAGWTTALLLLSAYNLWALFGWAYTDLAALAYGAAALVALERWRQTGGRGWLMLAGLIVGLAVGVKYTAAALAGGVGVYLLVYRRPQQPFLRHLIISGLIAGGCAALAYAPWAIRGILHYGSPIYPFAFGGLNWDATRAAFFSFSERGLLATGQAWQAILVPVSATVFGIDRRDGFGFTAGPWLLTSLLLLPLVWRWLDERARRTAAGALLFLAPMIAVWTVTALGSSVGMQTRLMTMTLPAFAIAGALGLHGLASMPKKPLDAAFIVRVLLVVTVVVGALDAVRLLLRDGAPQYALGALSEADYRYQNTQAYAPAMAAMAALALPDGSQVRFMWEPRGYWCPPALICRADVLIDHWLHPMIAHGRSADEVFAFYRESGDDYLLVWRAGYDEYAEVFARYADQNAQFYPALERHMVEVWTDGLRYSLYAWR